MPLSPRRISQPRAIRLSVSSVFKTIQDSSHRRGRGGKTTTRKGSEWKYSGLAMYNYESWRHTTSDHFTLNSDIFPAHQFFLRALKGYSDVLRT